MNEPSSIRAALGLLHLPAQLRLVRLEPLPSDTERLLRIVSGNEDCEREAAHETDRPAALIREAAIFYVEQVLLCPESDHYRKLGTRPLASSHELRHNMALLLSWLHPDKNPSGDRAVLAARVTEAWNTLRSPERRAAYDAALAVSEAKRRAATSGPRKPSQGRDPQRRLPALHSSSANASRPALPERRGVLDWGLMYLRRILTDRSTP